LPPSRSWTAIDRWTLAFIHHHYINEWVHYAFLLLIVFYEWSTGKVQRVTVWASLFVIIVLRLRIPVGQTAAWQALATRAQSVHI
jgi:hypothetical protein